MAHCIFCS